MRNFCAFLLIFSLFLTNSEAVSKNRTGILSLQVEKCPQVLGCRCDNGDKRNIQCFSIDESKFPELVKVYGAGIRRLEIHSWKSEQLHFDGFAPFTQLDELIIQDAEIEVLNGTVILPSLTTLSLKNCEISSDSEICNVIGNLPKLQNLYLNKNYLEKFECQEKGVAENLQNLDLSGNQISKIKLPKGLQNLYISDNLLTSIDEVPRDLRHLAMDRNEISSWPTDATFPSLTGLSASNLNIKTGFHLDAPILKSLNIDFAALEYLDFHQIKTPQLTQFSALQLKDLQNVAGSFSETIDDVKLTETKLKTLPMDFVKGSSPLSSGAPHRIAFNFSSSGLICNKCLLQWALPVFQQSKIQEKCNFTRPEIVAANCTLGVVVNGTAENEEFSIQYGKYEKPKALSCYAYGNPPPKITWFRYRPSQRLGSYNPETDQIDYEKVPKEMRESYTIQSGGSLLIHSPNRSHVERYVCVAQNVHGVEYGIYRFRLDYLDWYGYDVFHSVFYGGLATSLIVCLISFLLNITWILTRKSALWWIQRAERLSRVRKMVEAMEKYRVRQMECLHEKYTKRVQTVRDNYHNQVEALRVSYTNNQKSFQDFKAEKMEAVHTQFDSLRDNYNSQLARVREYGSKRAEQLWESYERQVNKMRTFSLQHRLKMMRQYKVKQRYVNKLLESFQSSSHDTLENEEKVRAALEIPDDLKILDGGDMDTPQSRLSRSSSFHSLPEYVIDEQGNVVPGIPPANGIRFSMNQPSTSSTSNGAGTSSSSSSGVVVKTPESPSTSSWYSHDHQK